MPPFSQVFHTFGRRLLPYDVIRCAGTTSFRSSEDTRQYFVDGSSAMIASFETGSAAFAAMKGEVSGLSLLSKR